MFIFIPTGIAVGDLVLPCVLERRKLGLGKLGAARRVEMMAFISEENSWASGAAEPTELEEVWLIEAAQDILMMVKGVEWSSTADSVRKACEAIP